MPSLKDIRDRIRSVSNTAKITSAMQLIAASRMQRAQQMVRNGRPYADRMQEVLSHLTMRLADDDETLDPLLQRRPNNREMLVLITPDRGLAGALVGNILRAAAAEFTSSAVPIDTVGIGRKGERFIARTGQSLIATFSVGDRPTLADTLDISGFVIDRYRDGDVDTVKMIYAQFVNTAVQKPVNLQLLPIETAAPNSDDEPMMYLDYIYEPSPAEVLAEIAPRYVETQIYHAILEAQASEHSARMIAMQNATDNANELIDELTLDLNKARQESITGELLDIVGGVAGVQG